MCSLFCTYWCAKMGKPAYQKEDEIPIDGKIVVVTGANSGIGAVCALEMAQRGATVIMACRDVKKGATVMKDIQTKVKDAKLDLIALDLGDFDSVRACANEIKNKYSHINILLNNAGVFFPDSELHKTKAGLEAHFATNHLGHFLLTILLLDHLQAGAPCRIVFTASSLYQLADLDLNDLMLEKRGSFGFRYWGPYNNSKLCNMYCVKELAKRLSSSSGVTVYAICPGYVKTDIFRNESGFSKCISCIPKALFGISPKEGVETILYCALSKNCSSDTGKMYHFNSEWKSAIESLSDETSVTLWEKSAILVGLKDEELPKIWRKGDDTKSQAQASLTHLEKNNDDKLEK